MSDGTFLVELGLLADFPDLLDLGVDDVDEILLPRAHQLL